MAKVGIVGASGYTGAELLRLLAGHPDLEVAVATGSSQAGEAIAGLYPNLVGAYGDRTFDAYDPRAVDGARPGVLRACPTGPARAWCPSCGTEWVRWSTWPPTSAWPTPTLYPEWYGEAHTVPELLAEAVYGLPELFRADLVGASLVAGPGCYPTAAALALAPLLRAGLVEPTGIVVDAVSGVSGAGRPPKPTTTFCAVDGDVTAYGLLRHRHTPGDRADPRPRRRHRGPGRVHPPPGAHEPGDAGHLLLPARSAGTTAADVAEALPRRLRRRALRVGRADVAVDQGHPGLQRRPRGRPPRRAHRLGALALRPRQPGQGRLRRAPSSAPTWPSASPRPTGLSTIGTYP